MKLMIDRLDPAEMARALHRATEHDARAQFPIAESRSVLAAAKRSPAFEVSNVADLHRRGHAPKYGKAEIERVADGHLDVRNEILQTDLTDACFAPPYPGYWIEFRPCQTRVTGDLSRLGGLVLADSRPDGGHEIHMLIFVPGMKGREPVPFATSRILTRPDGTYDPATPADHLWVPIPVPPQWWDNYNRIRRVGPVVSTPEQVAERAAWDAETAAHHRRAAEIRSETVRARGRGDLVALELLRAEARQAADDLRERVAWFEERAAEHHAEAAEHEEKARRLCHCSIGYEWLGVIATAHSLLACKNVTTDPHEPDPGLSRSHRKRTGHGLTKFYTLAITSPSGKRDARDTTTTIDGVTALHLRRGHFKVYGEDRPLFGKYHGRYYWAPHVAGKAEHGVIVKDYDVIPPSA